jgi:hypothetical protein
MIHDLDYTDYRSYQCAVCDEQCINLLDSPEAMTQRCCDCYRPDL